MRPRIADTLKTMDYAGTVEEFGTALAEVKAEKFAAWSLDNLCYARDEAAEFCQRVRKRRGATRFTRVFILNAPVGPRKNPAKAR